MIVELVFYSVLILWIVAISSRLASAEKTISYLKAQFQTLSEIEEVNNRSIRALEERELLHARKIRALEAKSKK